VQADGLHLAQVSYLPAPAPCLLPADFAHLADLLREVLPKFGGAYAYVAAHYEDAGWVADRLAEIVPLALEERQSLLELDDPLARLTQVAAWSARQPTTAQI
jgi:Lon protease-like protein